MCGIVGYAGSAPAADFLVAGLRRLEYRGYDSAGIATHEHDKLVVNKAAGRVETLAGLVKKNKPRGSLGIGHTRWATHGPATDANAHPHLGGDGVVAVVHNGVIENFREIKQQLAEKGYYCKTATDTEVVAQLIAAELDARRPNKKSAAPTPTADQYSPLIEAIQAALAQLRGTYGLAMVFRDWPDVIVVARLGSPLVIGVGDGEHFIASDGSPLVGHTDRIVYLADNEIAIVTASAIRVIHRDTGDVGHNVKHLDIDTTQVELGDFPHYMLKEIFEQPATIRDAMRGRLSREEATAKLGGLGMSNAELRKIDRLILTGCGTASHAAMCGEYIIEALAHVPCEVEFASEFRYRNMPMTRDTLVFCISQSGETADTLAALRESQRKGHRTLGICNNVASTIARESDGGVYMHAGPEIGVAATKSFTSQVTIMTLIALLLGRIRHVSTMDGMRIIEELEAIPDKVARILDSNDHIKAIAEKYADSQAMMFLGRQFNYPIALEGALKMKEISYIHASGHPSAELKHGVIALITPQLPSIVIAPEDSVFDKNISNIEEVKARNGPVIAIGTEGCEKLARVADEVIWIPACPDYLSPILTAIPLQLLAYHTAAKLGCDVDKPRNLAKSVTVE
jgi:glutamine---fructose-6-phosphate transaminase (isomerizing)